MRGRGLHGGERDALVQGGCVIADDRSGGGRLPRHERRADEHIDDRLLPVGGLPGQMTGCRVWGVTGYGTGSLNLTPDGASALETGVSMAMSAIGTRGELIGSRATGGFALAFKADALWVGAASDLLDGAAGRLNASKAGGDAGADCPGGLAGLHAGWPAVADAERRGGAAPRRRRRGDGRGHGCRRRARLSPTRSRGCRWTCGCGRWWCTRPKGSPSAGCRCGSGGTRRRRARWG